MKARPMYLLALCFMLLIAQVSASLAQAKGSRRSSAKSRITQKAKFTGTPGQYPESSDRLLTEEDIEHVTPWGMKVMQNEIYARHGYIFKDASLRKHFRKEKWYKGKERNMKKIKLTNTEIQNIAFIKQHQSKAKL